jgi:hypothetical protein
MGLHDDPPPAEDPAHPGDPARPEDPAYRERDWGDSGEGHGTDVEERSATGTGDASATEGRDASRAGRSRTTNMLPGRERRRFSLERLLVRLIATGGVIGIGVAIAAILASSKVQGWIIGLVVAAVSVVLSAILWSSRQL